MVEQLAPHHSFQYATPDQQADTAVAGMWLFLATEMLFFGGLFLAFLFCRYNHASGFARAAQETNLSIGAVNTALLLTSSFVFSLGQVFAETKPPRRVWWTCILTAALGVAFLVLKGIEWNEDFHKNLFPGPGFGLTGPDSGGAQLFYTFYFVATGLHGIHMLAGLGLVAWLALRVRHGELDDGWTTPVEVTGLYWSFVDMIWVVLFPPIYLLGRLS
jgi:cytochrome c oxidase subunit III